MIPLDNEHNYPITVAPKTATGHPARVDGPPVWSSSDPDVFTLDVAPDGLSAKLITADTGDEIRQAQLKITADADLGDGVKSIAFEDTVVVGPAMADSLGVSLGEGEAKS